MRLPSTLAVVLCLSMSLVHSAAAATPGVGGDLYLIEKDRTNAGVKPTIQVHVGDKIEITWSYPVVPGSIPTIVGAKSDAPAVVKVLEVRRIIKPGIMGAGTLGAFYSADSVGTTVIHFDINDGGTGALLQCVVEVSK